MFLGDVTAIVLGIIGFLLSLQGLWLLCRALWPTRVERSAECCRRSGVASFFVGIPITVVTVLFFVILWSRGGTPGKVAAWLIGAVFLMYAGAGMSGLVTFIGESLASPVDSVRPWRSTIRGGIVFELACLIPVIGWLVLLPVALILGTGAATLSFFWSPRKDLQATLYANRSRALEPQARELPRLEPMEASR
jgi:hypothetical protein